MSLLDKERRMWDLVSNPEKLQAKIGAIEARAEAAIQDREARWNALSPEEQARLERDSDAYYDFLFKKGKWRESEA